MTPKKKALPPLVTRGFEYAPGKFITNVHPRRPECDIYGCVVHSPTDHSMRHFPLHWRGDRRMFERICPHGIGHPDPDHMNWYRRTYGETEAKYEAAHGCDGCCSGHQFVGSFAKPRPAPKPPKKAWNIRDAVTKVSK